MRSLLLCCAALLTPLVAVDYEPSPLVQRLRRLDRMTDEERKALVHELAWERQQLLESLLKQLDSATAEARIHAAYLLGFFRLEQACPQLARRIVMVDEGTAQRSDDYWFWGRNVAQEALIRIGKPATAALLDNLASSDDGQVRKLSADALRAIEGALARAAIEDAARREPGTTRRRRLEAATALIE